MTDTNTCPECGSKLRWNSFQVGCTNIECLWNLRFSDKKMPRDEAYGVALHRIRELEHESRNARELHRAITQMTRRTDPTLEQPDMTDLGQDVAFVVYLIWTLHRRIAAKDEALGAVATLWSDDDQDEAVRIAVEVAREALKK